MSDTRIWDEEAHEMRELNHVERISLALIRANPAHQGPLGWGPDPMNDDLTLLRMYGESARPIADGLVAAVREAVRLELAAMRDAGELAPTENDSASTT